MKDLSEEELTRRFPFGWRVELKRKTLSDGTIREYECRRAKRPPRVRREDPPPVKKRDLMQLVKNLPKTRRERALRALTELSQSESSPESESEYSDSDQTAESGLMS